MHYIKIEFLIVIVNYSFQKSWLSIGCAATQLLIFLQHHNVNQRESKPAIPELHPSTHYAPRQALRRKNISYIGTSHISDD